MFRFVISTRSSDFDVFSTQTLTGQSLSRLARIHPIQLDVAYNARSGLASVYNPVIEAAAPEDVLIFMHDDVLIDDWQLPAHLLEALQQFEVVGVAGNAYREPMQTNWWGKNIVNDQGERQFVGCGLHRGAIAYAHSDQIEFWSGEPHATKQMDGVFLASRAATLQNKGIRFDPQFPYHIYDVDFCRQCEEAGVSMGVWPLALSHQSGGQLDETWYQTGLAYLAKWGS